MVQITNFNIWLVRKDMDVKELDKLSNITLGHIFFKEW